MAEQDPGVARPVPQEGAITLTLTPAEVSLVRTALEGLYDDFTHRDHEHAAIRAILARLPAAPPTADYRAPE
jgi:hypothetical protein